MDSLIFWIPVGLYACLLLGVLYYFRAVASEEEYFLARRKVGGNQSFISVVATETSVATIVLFPAAGFASGLSLIWLCAGYVLGRWLVAALYLRKVYERHKLSLYHTLAGESALSRRTLSGFYLLAKFISSGVRFYMAGFALEQLFGWSVIGWIFVTALVVGLYSLAGGLRAVVLTDQIQAGVIIGMGLALCGVLFMDAGKGVIPAPELIRAEFSYDNSLYFLALLIGGTVLSIGTHGADQDTLQRIFATSDVSAARRALVLSAFGATLVIVLYLIVGHLLKYAYAGQLNERSPLVDYISRADSPFFIGCFAVLLFAAAMSTLDSAIHATGAVWKDLLESNSSGRWFSFLSLGLLVVFGLLFMVLDRMQRGDFLALAMGSSNYVNGGLIGIFTVYTFVPRYLKSAGVVLALCGGFLITVACNFWITPAVAWSWVIVLSSAGAFVLCVAGGAVQARLNHG